MNRTRFPARLGTPLLALAAAVALGGNPAVAQQTLPLSTVGAGTILDPVPLTVGPTARHTAVG